MTTRELNQETAQLGEINEEAKARIRSMDTNTRVRLWMALVISSLFILLNAAVIFLIWNAFNADIALLREKLIQNDQRLITENVFMSLIGDTDIQMMVTLVGIIS